MEGIFETYRQQWFNHVPDGSCQLLNKSGTGDFLMFTCSGRLRAAAGLRGIAGSCVSFYLNLEGSGTVSSIEEVGFRSSHLVFTHEEPGAETRWQRFAGNHRFITLAFSIDYLRGLLRAHRETISPPVRAAMDEKSSSVLTEPMSLADKAFAQALASPPVVSAASHLWFHSKATEFIATHCYEQPDQDLGGFFCSQQKRLANQRIDAAKRYLVEHLDEPLKLEAVARAAGTSPHYLSRTFSKGTGLTLSRYLRSLRIERAAELLASGRMNISEAAIEVGYRSQSHFARAFEIEKSCTPSEYLNSLRAASR